MPQILNELQLGRVLHLTFDDYAITDYALSVVVEVQPKSIIVSNHKRVQLSDKYSGVFCLPVYLYFIEDEDMPGWYHVASYTNTSFLRHYASEAALLLNHPCDTGKVHFDAVCTDKAINHVMRALVDVNVLEGKSGLYRFKEEISKQ